MTYIASISDKKKFMLLVSLNEKQLNVTGTFEWKIWPQSRRSTERDNMVSEQITHSLSVF